MISRSQKEILMNNWGEKAMSLACRAEIRFFDPLSPWECYIYAMNPENEDEVSCLIKGFTAEIDENCSLKYILSQYNSEGNPPEIDYEYRPTSASQLFKNMCEDVL